MSLAAEFDPVNISLIIFNEPVTLQHATQFLWGTARSDPPMLGPALSPDPAEHPLGALHRRFIIRNDASLYSELIPANLTAEFTRRGGAPALMAPAYASDYPEWLPQGVRNRIESGSLHDGVTRFRGPSPWGDVVVWQHRTGPFRDVQYYLEFPSGLDFYLHITAGDRAKARLLQRCFVMWNGDLSYFVERRGMSPREARSELIRINNELFRQVLQGALVMLGFVGAINAAVSIMRSFSQRIAQMSDSLQATRRGLPPLSARPRITSMSVEEREQMLQNMARGEPGAPRENVYLGRNGREEYVREWVNHGGVGEPPECGFQVIDENGRVIRRIGYRSPNEPVTQFPAPGIQPPASTIAGAGGTLLERLSRERFMYLKGTLPEGPSGTARLVMIPNGLRSSTYLERWIAAGGVGSPPIDGFAVWSAQLEEVVQLVIPHAR